MNSFHLESPERNGDFRRFIEQYENYVVTIALRILGNREEAKDAAQETFIKLYRSLDRLDREKNEKNWVCTIAVNTCRDHFRKRHREGTVPLEGMDLPARPNPIDERLWARELLLRLPLPFREVLVLFYMEDRSVKEISKILKLPEILVKVRLFRARKSARALIEED